jgi:hypothetical protein
MPPARLKAQAQAALARVTCPPEALYYACHLAPWGLMSLDPMTRYMAWNGAYSALPFINHFEYTRNLTFAANVTLPLLHGLNAWLGCYWNKTRTGPGPDDYVYADDNPFNPDYEHEGQTVPNPQIALAFLLRTVQAEVDIAAALGLPSPPVASDILAHLPALNTAQVNVSTNVTFAVLNNTRCKNDEMTFYNVPTLAACEALCAAAPACGVFSYCPPATGPQPLNGGCLGTGGEPAPLTCWGYAPSMLPDCVTNATGNAGWTSGVKQSDQWTEATVWTAFQGATLGSSDAFALYPSWPAEAVEPAAAVGADPALGATAQASSRLYSDFANGRPVEIFPMAVRAGTNASAAAALAWTAAEVLDGLQAYLHNYQGPNLLPYAPGGGIENTGVTRAINEMLLGSTRLPGEPLGSPFPYVLQLFPFWPNEPAAFAGLLAKGGFVVAAEWDAAAQAVASPVVVTAEHTLGGSATSVVHLLSPWGGEAAGLTVTCGGGGGGGGGAEVTWGPGDVASWTAPQGVPCSVARGSGGRG